MAWNHSVNALPAIRKPKYKVFSIAVPYDEHESFKQAVQRALARHRRAHPKAKTHEAIRALLDAKTA